MKLIWHIIRKDIRREQWGLLLWAMLFVGQMGIGVVVRRPVAFDPEDGMRWQLASIGLVWLQMGMGYVLVARLVQADALVGTSGFWPTRPISPLRLFVAKALGALLLFGLLPVVVLVPWWLYCNFGWREIFWTGVETLGWQLLMIGPAFLVAALTDDLGRVLLWTLLLVIGLLSWVVLLQASFGRMAGVVAPGAIAPGILFTKFWLSAVVLVAGGFAIAAHHYLTRRFVRSVVLVACCLGLMAAVGQWGRWNWGRAIGLLHIPVPTGAPEMTGQLTLAVGEGKGTLGQPPTRRGAADGKDATLILWLRARGLPDDLTMAVERADQIWTWDDGVKLSRVAYYITGHSPAEVILRRRHSLPVPPSDAETDQWHARRQEKIDERLRARGLPTPRRVAATTGDGIPLVGHVNLPNSLLAKMKAEAPAYRADLSCILYRPEVLTELAFKDDVRAVGPAQTFHLHRPEGSPPWMLVTHSSVTRMGLWYSAAISAEIRSWMFRQRIMAVNLVTGDIQQVRENQQGSVHLQVAGVMINSNILHTPTRMVIRDEKEVPMDPRWHEHTQLVVIADREVARFRREVQAGKFALEPDAPGQVPGISGF